MSADEFQTVARVAKHSRIAAAIQHVVGRVRTAGSRSVAVGLARRSARELTALTPAERVRLGGVLILVATLTQAVLLRWSPAMVRPAAPALLRLFVVALGLVLIVFAAPIAKAWGRSYVHRLLSRAVGSSKASTGDVERT